MEVRDLLHDRESEPEAANLTAVLLGGEVRVEDAVADLAADAGPFVRHLQVDAAAVPGHGREADGGSGVGGVEGIVHEVHQHALQQDKIPRQGGFGCHRGYDGDADTFRVGGRGGADPCEKRAKIDRIAARAEVFPEKQGLAHVISDGFHRTVRGCVHLRRLGAWRKAALGVY